MEEPSNTSNCEIDVSDSWTIVNDDSEVNGNADIGETSDSESLEVLEVEQEESEQHCQDDLEIEGEEKYHEECSKDSDEGFLFEDPLIHLGAIQKVKKYVHHPSAYINMWLSVVMVVAIAVTLGLGIGHYLGSNRFAKAKDMIHHLKYENQMLEQELADVTMKNKHCASDLHSRVRQLVVYLKPSELSDNYCRSYNFQDNIYANLIHVHDEDVCYAEENPVFSDFLKHMFVNNTFPPFVHWISYMNDGEEALDFPYEDEFIINKSYIITKNSNNTSFDVEMLPELEVINDQLHLNKSHIPFSELNTRLTYLHSLLKKWNKFRGNLKLPSSDFKTDLAGMQNIQHVSEVAHETMPVVSGNPYTVLNENVKSLLSNSLNGFCRSKINQCILREENLQKKEKKCYVLTKAQLLCSLLPRNKKKQNNILLGEQKARKKQDMKPSIAPQFSLEQKKYRKAEKVNFTHDIKKEKRENGKLGSKMYNFSKSDSKRMKNKIKAENSKSDFKRMKYKNKAEDSSKNVSNKEKSYSFKYITKDQNIYQKEKKHNQFKKQAYNRVIHWKEQLSNPITKYQKQFKNYYSKENIKNNDKKHIIWDKNKKKYSEKFPNINRKNVEKFKSCSNDKRQCKFHKIDEKMTENKKYFAHSRFDFSKKSYLNYGKYSSSENANRDNIKDLKEYSNDGGHCKFHLNDKKMSEDKKHYKCSSLEKSYKFKNHSNEKNNDSENASCKYSFIAHQKDKNFPKYWKERNKMYDLHMQELKIFKT